MKKSLILLAFLALFTPITANADESGQCGNNLTWTFVEETGTLTISGTGNMWTFDNQTKRGWDNYRRTKIKTVVIEEGVTSIGGSAFDYCEKLTSVTIPNSVTRIYHYAFRYCTSLTSITIGDNVTDIGDSAFEHCSGLTSVTIGSSVTHIGGSAFQECTSLTSIEIPNSVTSIGSRAFADCTALTSVSIPNTVEHIYSTAFLNTPWFSTRYESAPEGLFYIDDILFGYKGDAPKGDITIKEGTKIIASQVFYDCTDLTSVTIPNSVTYIGNSAFFGCSGLTSITIPNSVTFIYPSTFSGCSGLTSITIPNSVTFISTLAFSGCSSLTSITIPNSVTGFGQYAFSGCKGLTSVTIPGSVTDIAMYTFRNCTSLSSVIIEEGVTYIQSSAFSGCTGLTSVSIPKSITLIYADAFKDTPWYKSYYDAAPDGLFYIDNIFFEYKGAQPEGEIEIKEGTTILACDVFRNCANLTKVKIPSSVTSIGHTFFSSCTGLTDIYCYAEEVPFTGQAVFFNSSISSATLHVPESAISAYQETEPWNSFGNIVPIKPLTLSYVVDGELYKSYQLYEGDDIIIEDVPQKEGYTFSGWSEIPTTMPAEDVTITGTFTINSYKLTYMIDEEVYKETTVEYGATITAEPKPEGDYQTFEWVDLPETMPAHDVVVHASYTTGIDAMMATQRNMRIYSPDGKRLNTLQRGLNIVVYDDGTVHKILMK